MLFTRSKLSLIRLTVITLNKPINHGAQQPVKQSLPMKKLEKLLQKQKKRTKAQLVVGTLVLQKLRMFQLTPTGLLLPKAPLLPMLLLHQSRSPSQRIIAVPTQTIYVSKQRRSQSSVVVFWKHESLTKAVSQRKSGRTRSLCLKTKKTSTFPAKARKLSVRSNARKRIGSMLI